LGDEKGEFGYRTQFIITVQSSNGGNLDQFGAHKNSKNNYSKYLLNIYFVIGRKMRCFENILNDSSFLIDR
jgi:hypothetical protein